MGTVISVYSYPDTPEGNQAVEKDFTDTVKDRYKKIVYTDEEIQDMIESGYCDDPISNETLSIVHSQLV